MTLVTVIRSFVALCDGLIQVETVALVGIDQWVETGIGNKFAEMVSASCSTNFDYFDSLLLIKTKL